MFNRLSSIIDIVFPCFCVTCGCWVRSRDYHLCPVCSGKIRPALNSCSVCGGLLHDDRCLICSSRKVYMSGNVPVYDYDGSVKKLLQGLKFHGLRNAYRKFLPGMARAVNDMPVRPDLVTFVPMSRQKKAKRGYNQSGLIAAALGKELGIECAPVLSERAGFRPQRALGRLERYINVIDRYKACDINKFRGRTVLLVDDVFTTGATINECSRLLLKYGASAVYSVTVARADPEKNYNTNEYDGA